MLSTARPRAPAAAAAESVTDGDVRCRSVTHSLPVIDDAHNYIYHGTANQRPAPASIICLGPITVNDVLI